jgi:hypothetical protein
VAQRIHLVVDDGRRETAAAQILVRLGQVLQGNRTIRHVETQQFPHLDASLLGFFEIYNKRSFIKLGIGVVHASICSLPERVLQL